MAKPKRIYSCTECGYECPKWLGQCPECRSWNTLEEEVRAESVVSSKKTTIISMPNVYPINNIVATDEIRYKTSIKEMDRVLGGGIVPGAVMLISGDPGIGKSTILLQISKPLCEDKTVLYVSGEESIRQIKLRANRLSVDTPNLHILSHTDLNEIIAVIETQKPDIVIIDSIQTLNASYLTSAPGSVTQTKECTTRLITIAKTMEIPMFIVGHVNKDGAIAGPKVMEHMVDTVLYFEGERNMPYRILRAIKNRYGSTNEIGVFEMLEEGLSEVLNPSAMLLSGRPGDVPGTVVTCIVEGSRPILAEVQALVSKTSYPVPKRSANGVDSNRVAMLLAVLEKRSGYFMGNMDTYINVVGGLRIDEPASDLAIVMSVISNITNKALGENLAVFGEIGLAGEVRNVSHVSLRVNEAYRLGFKRIILPKKSIASIKTTNMPDVELIGVDFVGDLRKLLG